MERSQARNQLFFWGLFALITVGVFVLSIIQGLAMGVFYVLAGVPYAGFWTMLSIALSVIPLVGIILIHSGGRRSDARCWNV